MRTRLGFGRRLILSQRVNCPFEFIPFRMSKRAVFFSSPTLCFILTTIIIPTFSAVIVVKVGSIVSSGVVGWRALPMITRTLGFPVAVVRSRRTATATLIRDITIILVVVRASLQGIIRRLLEACELRRKIHGGLVAARCTSCQ